MKKRAVLLGLLLSLTLSTVVLAAANYSAPVTVTESSSNSYTKLPITVSVDNDYLVDSGFMGSTGLDTRVLSGGTPLPHLVADDKTLFVSDVTADSQETYSYTTGNDDLTSFDIITGYGGKITITDAVALELGNNFEIELDDVYVNTDSGSSKYLVYKEGAFSLYVSGSEEIKAEMASDAGIVQETQILQTQFTGVSVWSIGQRLDSFPAVTITSVDLYLKKVGSPTGTLTLYLKDVSPDANIGAIGTLDVSTLTTSFAWYTFDTTPVANPSSQDVRVIGYYPLGDGANYVAVGHSNTDLCNGQFTRYAGSWFDVGTQDLTFRMYVAAGVTVTATGVSSGLMDIIVAANGTNLTLTIDTVEEDSTPLSGASVIDTVNDWVIMDNSTTQFASYMKYYKHTVSSTLIAWYQPITIIATTVLPDREGTAQNGAITWGTNPVGVVVEMGALLPETSSDASVAASSEVPTFVPTTEDVGDMTTSGVEGTGLPFYGVFKPLLDQWEKLGGPNISMPYFWKIAAVVVGWLFGTAVMLSTRSLTFALIAYILAFSIPAVAMGGVLDLWVPIVYAMGAVSISLLISKWGASSL